MTDEEIHRAQDGIRRLQDLRDNPELQKIVADLQATYLKKLRWTPGQQGVTAAERDEVYRMDQALSKVVHELTRRIDAAINALKMETKRREHREQQSVDGRRQQ